MFLILIVSSILFSWLHLSWTQRNNPRARKMDLEWQVMLLSSSFFIATSLLLWRIVASTPHMVALDAVSTALAVTGSILRALSIYALGQNFSWGSKPPEKIVRDGIYRYTKHPLIIGYVLQTMGMAIAGNGAAMMKLIPVVGVIFAAWIQMRREEKEIEKCFGKS
jgi:protein-S-isoprenylcysteine O-methyltransferase Ste14